MLMRYVIKRIKFLQIMKKQMFYVLTVLGTVALFNPSCSKNSDIELADEIPVALLEVSTKSGSEGITTFNLNNVDPAMDTTGYLNADEIELLYAMREDEKLARDLYTFYSTEYPDVPVFKFISVAKSNHIAAIEKILTYYEIDFPKVGDCGVFQDSSLQSRYNDLINVDSAMVALVNMAILEEENIVAYTAVLEAVDNPNIRLLLINMVRASSNHLRASVRVIQKMGGVYSPRLLDQELYDQIIQSGFQYGEMYKKRRGNGTNSQGSNSQKRGDQQGRKGSVNGSGTCTETINGGLAGSNSGAGSTPGNVGRGYRGGR